MNADVQQLTRERDRLRLLLEVTNAVAAHLDLHDLLHAISVLLSRLVPHDLSNIALYDPQGTGFTSWRSTSRSTRTSCRKASWCR